MVNINMIIIILMAVTVRNNNSDSKIQSRLEILWSNIDAKPYNEKAKDFCSDRPTLSIHTNRIFTGIYYLNNANNSLLFSYNGAMYSVIDSIDSKTKLPVVNPSVTHETKLFEYPRYMDKAVELVLNNSRKYEQLIFDDFAYYSVSNQKQMIFIGYNQVWFNCPQPLPIDAQIDAIVTRDDYVWLFRGQYFWESSVALQNTSFRVENARHVSAWDHHMPTHFDASFTDNALIIYIFKANFYMTYNGKMSIRSRLRPVRTLFGDNFPHFIDSAFYNTKTLCAYIFKGDMYWIYKMNETKPILMNGYPKHVKSLNKHFPINLNTAAVIRDEVYIFKGWKFAKFSNELLLNGSLNSISLNFRYIFTDFFQFSPQMYAQEFGFNSYHELITRYGSLVKNESESQDTGEDIQQSNNANDRNFFKNNWILIVILCSIFVCALLMTVCVVFAIHRKYATKQTNKLKNKIQKIKLIANKYRPTKTKDKKNNNNHSRLVWRASTSSVETHVAKPIKINRLKNKDTNTKTKKIAVIKPKTTDTHNKTTIKS